MARRIKDAPIVCSVRDPSNGTTVIKIIDIETHCIVSPDLSDPGNSDMEKEIDKTRKACENLETVAADTTNIEEEVSTDQSTLQNDGPKYKIMNWILALLGCLFSFSAITCRIKIILYVREDYDNYTLPV